MLRDTRECSEFLTIVCFLYYEMKYEFHLFFFRNTNYIYTYIYYIYMYTYVRILVNVFYTRYLELFLLKVINIKKKRRKKKEMNNKFVCFMWWYTIIKNTLWLMTWKKDWNCVIIHRVFFKMNIFKHTLS